MCKKWSFRALTMQHDSTHSVFFFSRKRFLNQDLIQNLQIFCEKGYCSTYCVVVYHYNEYHIYVHITYDCRITCFLFFKSEIRGVENNDDYPIMLQKLWKKSKDDIKDWRERQSHLSLMPVLPKRESSQGRALFKKQSKELDPGQTFLLFYQLLNLKLYYMPG